MSYDLAWIAMFCLTMEYIRGFIFPVESTHIGSECADFADGDG